VHIGYLSDRPELIDALALGLLDEYREILPEETLETRRAKLRAHLNREALPIAWVAHDGDEAIGTAALRVCDLEGYERLTPWLGGVYVFPRHRRRGIGSALCAAVEEKARAMGFGRLYLFTLDQQRLYARLGWASFEWAHWRGRESDVMVKRLGLEAKAKA
jgi:predicted N-acetyltransferase YhbS